MIKVAVSGELKAKWITNIFVVQKIYLNSHFSPCCFYCIRQNCFYILWLFCFPVFTNVWKKLLSQEIQQLFQISCVDFTTPTQICILKYLLQEQVEKFAESLKNILKWLDNYTLYFHSEILHKVLHFLLLWFSIVSPQKMFLRL